MGFNTGGGFSGVTSAGPGVNVGGTNAYGNPLGTGQGGNVGNALQIATMLTKTVGTGMEVYGEYSKTKAQAEASLYNAGVARQQALIVGQSAAFNTARLKKRARTLLATQEARYAKAGVRIDRGTPVDVMADSATEFELDILSAEYNAKIEMIRLNQQAELDELKARDVRSAGGSKIATNLLQQSSNFVTNYFVKGAA